MNRSQRRNEKKAAKTAKPVAGGNSKPQQKRDQKRGNPRNNNNNKMMMDTTPVNVQKRQQKSRSQVVIRANSGRPALSKNNQSSHQHARRPNSTPGLRQPWEKLPTAPLPAAPLKISIRNELAERSSSSSGRRMMDTDEPSGSLNYRAQPYEPRDSLASREEYRIGNRFSTQGMAIDYQLPSGASYDTRPTRRY